MHSANARFVDALMRIEMSNVPYVVELKAGSSQGQEFRHAFAQAVLYRQFIRKADIPNMKCWFKSRSLDPGKCRAVVAFPKLTGKNSERLLKQHKALGRAFDVEIVEIEGVERIDRKRKERKQHPPA